jgi:hypothetical protein
MFRIEYAFVNNLLATCFQQPFISTNAPRIFEFAVNPLAPALSNCASLYKSSVFLLPAHHQVP